MNRWIWLLIWMITAPVGCAETTENSLSTPPVRADVLYQGHDCVRHAAGAVWIDNIQDYESFFQQVGRTTLGGKSQRRPPVDFRDSGVLLIHMGQKSTSGYEVNLGRASVSVCGGIAVVYVDWVQPPADAMLAQMITHPCLLIKLPRNGYRVIRVRDQSGKDRFRVDVRTKPPAL